MGVSWLVLTFLWSSTVKVEHAYNNQLQLVYYVLQFLILILGGLLFFTFVVEFSMICSLVRNYFFLANEVKRRHSAVLCLGGFADKSIHSRRQKPCIFLLEVLYS